MRSARFFRLRTPHSTAPLLASPAHPKMVAVSPLEPTSYIGMAVDRLHAMDLYNRFYSIIIGLVNRLRNATFYKYILKPVFSNIYLLGTRLVQHIVVTPFWIYLFPQVVFHVVIYNSLKRISPSYKPRLSLRSAYPVFIIFSLLAQFFPLLESYHPVRNMLDSMLLAFIAITVFTTVIALYVNPITAAECAAMEEQKEIKRQNVAETLFQKRKDYGVTKEGFLEEWMVFLTTTEAKKCLDFSDQELFLAWEIYMSLSDLREDAWSYHGWHEVIDEHDPRENTQDK